MMVLSKVAKENGKFNNVFLKYDEINFQEPTKNPLVATHNISHQN